MYGIIYLITNKINGKQYVGQTTKKEIHQRWNKTVAFFTKNRQPISAAIEKYGIENFFFDKIDFANCHDELNWKERYFIQKLSTLAPSGYNLHIGGNSSPCHSDTKRKISEVKKGKVIISETQRKQLSIALKGRKQPLETKQKISDALKGIPTWNKGRKYNQKQLASRPRGENVVISKILEPDAKFILSSMHLSPAILAEVYNVNLTTITHIRRRITWKHIEINPNENYKSTIPNFLEKYNEIYQRRQDLKKINMEKVYKRKRQKVLKFTKDEALYIKESPLSSSKLAKELGVSITFISDIRNDNLPKYREMFE